VVKTGLDRLGSLDLGLEGARCGLLCHPASVTRDLRHAAELVGQTGAELCCLFGPEHGATGEAQDMEGVDSAPHPRLGVPVHSLYGRSEESLRPQPECLEQVDVVVIDLQDVGARYYTYVWSMVMMIEACAQQPRGIRVVVLDRPNPLGGLEVEGPDIEGGFTSFVGYHPVPVRHGLTAGEVAKLAVAELGLSDKVELEVVAMEGWRRDQLFDETGLPWVLPSPNMPTPEAALVYPGACLFEGTNVSEGRGTTRPFELVGAPWIDGWALSAELEREDLPGVRFRPTCFRPTFNKHAGRSCGGVQQHVTDRRAFRSFRTGVALLAAMKRLWPAETAWREQPYEFVHDRPAIDLLAGGAWLREGVELGRSLAELTAGWGGAEAAFRERRSPYLIYQASK
jgi:uncharacterized protein YbbC (DUF1343 family)